MGEYLLKGALFQDRLASSRDILGKFRLITLQSVASLKYWLKPNSAYSSGLKGMGEVLSTSPIPFNPEEYAEFGFNQYFNDATDWRVMSRNFPKISLDEAKRSWNNAPFNKYSPIWIEVALFNEFQYRFDYSWERKSTHKQQLVEYALVARYWTERNIWPRRPWRLSAFPDPPRCSVSNPYPQQYHRDMDQEAYVEYMKQCKLRRALIRAYPTILSNPDVWCRC